MKNEKARKLDVRAFFMYNISNNNNKTNSSLHSHN